MDTLSSIWGPRDEADQSGASPTPRRRTRRVLALLAGSGALIVIVSVLLLRSDALSIGGLTAIRDAMLLVLEIFGLGMLIAVTILMASSLFSRSEPKGTTIFPFEAPAAVDGKAVSESLTAELHRIFQTNDATSEQGVPASSGDGSPSGDGRILRGEASGREGASRLRVTRPSGAQIRIKPVMMKMTGESLDAGLADVATIGVGDTKVSLGRLLITLRQLRSIRQSEFIISGSLHRFGGLIRLVGRLEDRQGRKTYIWEVSQTVGDGKDDEIASLIRDLAFKIYQDVSTDVAASTWVGLKYFTEAKCAYTLYERSGRDEDLEVARTNCLLAARSERGYRLLADMLYALGVRYFTRGDYENSKELFGRVIAIGHLLDPDANDMRPLMRDAQNALGATFANLGNFAIAERRFRDAVALDGEHLPAFINLSKALAENGDVEEARATVQESKAARERTPMPKTDEADWLASVGMSEEAEALYTAAMGENPQDGRPHYRLADLYSETDRPDQAIAEYERALALHFAPASVHNDLGVVYANRGEWRAAIEHYRRAVNIDPLSHVSYNNLGYAYSNVDQFNDAISAYRRAIHLNEDFAAPHSNLGTLFRRLNRNDLALGEYLRAIELEPRDASDRTALGDIYASSDQPDQAIAAYRQAIECDPEYAYPHSGLGYVLRDRGDYEGAIKEFKAAIDLDPDELDFYLGLGGVYRRMHRFKDAIAVYQKASTENPLAQASIAACYKSLGDDAAYLKQVASARASATGWDTDKYNEACFEALCGNAEEAVRLLAIALRNREQSADYARRDVDFELIRENPGFVELVGAGAAADIK